jgi:hypothetical protein
MPVVVDPIQSKLWGWSQTNFLNELLERLEPKLYPPATIVLIANVVRISATLASAHVYLRLR